MPNETPFFSSVEGNHHWLHRLPTELLWEIMRWLKMHEAIDLSLIDHNVHKRLFPMLVRRNVQTWGTTQVKNLARHGHLRQIVALDRLGIDSPESPNVLGRALLYAIKYKSKDTALGLISNPRCNLAIRDKRKMRPLFIAIEYGLQEIALALISSGCNLNIQDGDPSSPLCYAMNLLDTNVAIALINNPKCNLNIQGWKRKTALHLAIKHGDFEVALALIANPRCDLNLQNPKKMTPLHFAIHKKQPEIALALIASPRCNLDVENVQNGNNWTTIQLAVEKNLSEVALALIEDPRSNIGRQIPTKAQKPGIVIED